MKSTYVGLRVASIVFGLVALVHLVRVLMGAERMQCAILGYNVGLLPSVIVILVAGWLSLWLGQLACAAKKNAAPPPPPA
jgi:hypothetical protein